MPSLPQSATKANLKLVAGKKPTFVAGGLEPDASMTPGEYVAMCEGARLTQKGKSAIVVLLFRVVDGPHTGTALRQWLTVADVNGVVAAGSKYSRHCQIALGQDEIRPGDSLDPEVVFVGKTFVVDVGYRLTEAGKPDSKNAEVKKGDRDFLRIHQILRRGEML